jgi:hypothetical protein
MKFLILLALFAIASASPKAPVSIKPYNNKDIEDF